MAAPVSSTPAISPTTTPPVDNQPTTATSPSPSAGETTTMPASINPDEPQSHPLAPEANNDSEKPTSAQQPTTTDTPPAPTRKQSEALGPATDVSPAAPPPTDSSVLTITLMLTTGARHPYKIDEKYLRSRKVDALDAQGQFDPREMSAYKLKELIWTDWRSEWEPRPASPSSIRLIRMGRMLEDKSPLKDFPFKLNDINVLHMTVKPADFHDDDEANAGTGKSHHITRARDGGEGGAGCRCVIL